MATLFCKPFIVLLALSLTAGAEDSTKQVVDRVVSSHLEAAFKAMDAKAEETGVNAYLVQIHGAKVSVRISGDEVHAVADFPGRSATRNRLNEWNRTKRFTCAYVDRSGLIHLRGSLSSKGGVTGETIGSFFAVYGGSLKAFLEHIE